MLELAIFVIAILTLCGIDLGNTLPICCIAFVPINLLFTIIKNIKEQKEKEI